MPLADAELEQQLRRLSDVEVPVGFVDNVMKKNHRQSWLSLPARFALGTCSFAAWAVAVQQMVVWSGTQF